MGIDIYIFGYHEICVQIRAFFLFEISVAQQILINPGIFYDFGYVFVHLSDEILNFS